jgi:uncharacterized protein (DUF488 family)
VTNPFFTIGHSTRPLGTFVDLLKSADIRLVVDVRTIPRSRSNPQYNSDAFAASLAKFKIEYEHIAALGGLRSRQRGVPSATNAFWQNESFHNYADYAMGEDFQFGLRQLRQLGRSARSAIMCAETLWWLCHRRIISDYLMAAGETVFHILKPGQVTQASVTSAVKLGASGALVYPIEAAGIHDEHG